MGKYTIIVEKAAAKELESYKKSGDKSSIKKIDNIFEDLAEHPYTGVGSPEALKKNLTGFWSRKINKKDRLIYRVNDEIVSVYVTSAKGHYNDK